MTPWTITCQVPLSIGFPRQRYWSGLPFPSPGDLPNPGTEFASPISPALAGGFFTSEPLWKPKGKVAMLYRLKKKPVTTSLTRYSVTIIGQSKSFTKDNSEYR